jgi:hypothetical protein
MRRRELNQAHRPLRAEHELAAILSLVEERRVQKSMGSQRARIYHEVWTAAYQIQKGARPHHF